VPLTNIGNVAKMMFEATAPMQPAKIAALGPFVDLYTTPVKSPDKVGLTYCGNIGE
jgi:hypothetical protein